MKAKRILSLVLTVLMVLSVCPVFVASAEYLASGAIYAADGETVRAMIHDWKTEADDEGFTVVSNQYFSDNSNPRPKFATWGTGTPAMNEDGEFVITASNPLMMEIDHLGKKAPSLSVPSTLTHMVIKLRTSGLDDGEYTVTLNGINRGSSVELNVDEAPYEEAQKNVRAKKFATFEPSADYQYITFDLSGAWAEIDDNGNDYTDYVKTPWTFSGTSQYRIDFPKATYAIDYIGFFTGEEDFAIYEEATRTFDDPDTKVEPTLTPDATNILVTEQATDENAIRTILHNYDSDAAVEDVVYAATASLKDDSGAPIEIDTNASYDIIVPKSLLGNYNVYMGTNGVLAYDAENVYLTLSGTELANGIVILGADTVELDGNTVYNYVVSYDADTEKAVVEVYVENADEDIQSAGFGFEVADGYTVSDFALNGSVVETAYGQSITETETGVVGAWMAKLRTDSVKTTSGQVLVATFGVEMTAEEYKVLRSDFITEKFPEQAIEYIYDATAGKYLYAPDAANTGVALYPVAGITVSIDYVVAVEAEGIDEYVTTAHSIADSAEMFEDFTFTATHEEGAYIIVTYQIGETGTPVEIEATEGVYTIPGDEVIDDITITFIYGTPIENVALTGLVVPVPLATPDTDVEAEEDANYTVGEVTWTPNAEKFDYATTYTASVVITANDEYSVNSNTVVTIDGEEAEVEYIGSGKIKATVEFETADRVAVDTVAVTDIDVPAAGNAPDTTGAVAEDANYTIESITWTPAVDEYDYITEYKVTVKVNTNEGYKVTTSTSFTINGIAATVTAADTTSITAEYTYTSADRETAGNLEVTVEAPAATATPEDAQVKLPEGETETPFSIVSTVWKDADGNPVDGAFGFETAYSATITVSLADTHKLPENFTITVGDKTFTAGDYTVNTDGTITFTVDFDKTGSNKATIDGYITLVRAAEVAPKTYATITFKGADGTVLRTEEIETAASLADENGTVAISEITLDFAPGTYSAVISKNGYLDYTVTDIVIAQMESPDEYTKLAFDAELVPGEISGDTKVADEDVSKATGAFADDYPTAGDDLVAVDIDEDGVYTIFDLGYILNNFGSKAEACTSAAFPVE